jgi:hypothetical protein
VAFKKASTLGILAVVNCEQTVLIYFQESVSFSFQLAFLPHSFLLLG